MKDSLHKTTSLFSLLYSNVYQTLPAMIPTTWINLCFGDVQRINVNSMAVLNLELMDHMAFNIMSMMHL